jgi:hypothetical protein
MSLGDYMTYEYMVVYTRLSTGTPFYPIPENVRDYIDAVWRIDDIMITSEALSDDGLTKISGVIFKDVESWLQFIDDPIIKLYLSERNAYHIENDITVTRLES